MFKRKCVLLTLLAGSIGVGQSFAPSIPALTATVTDTFVRTLPSGNLVTNTVTGQFYRDSQGRSRTERGQMVVIQDPVARTSVVVDLTSNTARRFSAGPRTNPGPSMTDVAGRPAREVLGTQMISGFPTKGFRSTVVVPPGAVGNLGPLSQTIEVWRSDALALTVELKTTDELSGEHTQLYSDIATGTQVDPSLFAIPAGVEVIEVQPAAQAGSQRLR